MNASLIPRRPAARIAAMLAPLGLAATPLVSLAALPTLEDPSRGLSRAPAMVAGPYSTPVALVSSQMPTTKRIAPTATVRPNWPQVARPVWISA